MQPSIVTRAWLASIVLALCALSLCPVSAHADERVAVLGLRAGDGLLGPAATVTRALRDASRDVVGWQLVSRDESLSELMSYHACRAPDARCMTRIGLSLGVDRVVYGTLRPAVDGLGLAVTLYAFDCYAARLVATVADTVAESAGEPVVEDTTLAHWTTELSVRRVPRPERVNVERTPVLGPPRAVQDGEPGSSPLQRAFGWGLLGGAAVSAIASFAALGVSENGGTDSTFYAYRARVPYGSDACTLAESGETYGLSAADFAKVRDACDTPFPWHAFGAVLGGAAAISTIVGVLLLLTDDASARRARRRDLDVSAELAPGHVGVNARVAF